MDMGDIVGIIGGAAAIAGAGVAIWQAIDARRARDEARKSSADAAALAADSNAAWQRIAAAQEVVAQAHRPKAWSDVKRGPGDLRTFRNTSERPIVVTRLDVTPQEAQPLLRVEGELPRRFKAGELLEIYTEARLGLSIRIVTIIWRFDDEDGPEHDSPRRVS
ncbi:hypothetical protein [Microbacterium sp. VKM Ac-2923]|uniref:hypothetical protein n=1 Tax=Microbacterium sp. VKM Ac-2923 TaxID=2929476 RepID=UPI001FB4A765|nr:hypothetical protein [Microbacterium sp. VKM Ac-2923]MCJ1706897.1 hypothetical protein [Microbacterium sp. VKM Ac-2923]